MGSWRVRAAVTGVGTLLSACLAGAMVHGSLVGQLYTEKFFSRACHKYLFTHQGRISEVGGERSVFFA